MTGRQCLEGSDENTRRGNEFDKRFLVPVPFGGKVSLFTVLTLLDLIVLVELLLLSSSMCSLNQTEKGSEVKPE